MADSYGLVDSVLGGKLPAELRELRAKGQSLDAIAAHYTARGFGVSRETIRRWLKRIDQQQVAS